VRQTLQGVATEHKNFEENLKNTYMNSEMFNQVPESDVDQNAQKIRNKSDLCRSPKILGQSPGPQERSF